MSAFFTAAAFPFVVVGSFIWLMLVVGAWLFGSRRDPNANDPAPVFFAFPGLVLAVFCGLSTAVVMKLADHRPDPLRPWVAVDEYVARELGTAASVQGGGLFIALIMLISSRSTSSTSSFATHPAPRERTW